MQAIPHLAPRGQQRAVTKAGLCTLSVSGSLSRNRKGHAWCFPSQVSEDSVWDWVVWQIHIYMALPRMGKLLGRDLLCKHEDLNSDPIKPCRLDTAVHTSGSQSSCGQIESMKTHRPASLWYSSKQQKDPAQTRLKVQTCPLICTRVPRKSTHAHHTPTHPHYTQNIKGSVQNLGLTSHSLGVAAGMPQPAHNHMADLEVRLCGLPHRSPREPGRPGQISALCPKKAHFPRGLI